MFPFKKVLDTVNFTPGVNSKTFIILHHTGTKEGSINGVVNTLTKGTVSCHFVVDTNGDAYKIANPDKILWHAGESQWWPFKGMNSYSIGIEIVWPLSNGSFTDDQRRTVRALVQHLMAVFKIRPENVLRHADLTWQGSASKKLWDGKSPSRKVDVADSFWKINRTLFSEYQVSLIPKEV